MIRYRKLSLTVFFVVGLAVLLGGCVGVKDRFMGMAEREPGLNPGPGLSGVNLDRYDLPKAHTPQYYKMALDAYNVAAKIADYSLLGSLKLNEAGVILNGFSEVTPALLEGFMNDAQQLPTLSSRGEPLLDYERGMQLLGSLSAEQIQSWLVQLAEALRDGRFDLVYGRLLQQEGGFRQLRDGIMYLLPRSRATQEQAKQLIRSLAEEVASAADPQQRARELVQLMQIPLWARVREAIRAFYSYIGEPNEAEAIRIAEELKQSLEAIFNRLPKDRRDEFNRDKFKETYENALKYILDKFQPHEAGRLFLGMHDMLKKIYKEIEGKPGFIYEAIDRSVFHFFVVVNVVEQHGARIVDIGRSIAGAQVPLVLSKTYLMRDGTQRDFLIYFAPFSGSLTHNLFAGGKYSELVISWIDAAAKDLIAKGGGIVGVHFIGGKPAEKIITEVQKKFAGSNVAIIISWTDDSGKLYYECIGALCGRLHPNSIRDQACMQAGRRPGAGCDAPTGQAQPGTMVQLSPGEGSPPPPPPPPPPVQ